MTTSPRPSYRTLGSASTIYHALQSGKPRKDYLLVPPSSPYVLRPSTPNPYGKMAFLKRFAIALIVAFKPTSAVLYFCAQCSKNTECSFRPYRKQHLRKQCGYKKGGSSILRSCNTVAYNQHHAWLLTLRAEPQPKAA